MDVMSFHRLVKKERQRNTRWFSHKACLGRLSTQVWSVKVESPGHMLIIMPKDEPTQCEDYRNHNDTSLFERRLNIRTFILLFLWTQFSFTRSPMPFGRSPRASECLPSRMGNSGDAPRAFHQSRTSSAQRTSNIAIPTTEQEAWEVGNPIRGPVWPRRRSAMPHCPVRGFIATPELATGG